MSVCQHCGCPFARVAPHQLWFCEDCDNELTLREDHEQLQDEMIEAELRGDIAELTRLTALLSEAPL